MALTKTMNPAPTIEAQVPLVRNFLRSLNILLKSARMYGMEHTQTLSQTKTSWEHLQKALEERRGSGVQLAVSEDRLIVDGTTVKAGPAEQSFVQMLNAADLASITFLPRAKAESFREMVHVFAVNASKPDGLAVKLKAALGDETQSGIRINEIRFVPADSGHSDGTVAAQLLAETMGKDSGQVQDILNNPGKLLQLITAADDSGTGATSGQKTGNESSTGPKENEEDIAVVIRLLGKLAHESGSDGAGDPINLHAELSQLKEPSKTILHNALAEFAEKMPEKQMGPHLLLQVAEHLAIRLALNRYEKGDSRVDAVTQMLGRMNREIDSLRETLSTYERDKKEPGFEAPPAADNLEQEFWAVAPEAAKLNILLSENAWQMPSRHVRDFIDQLVQRGEVEAVQQILLNYVSGIHSSLPESRRKTALGLKDLAEHYPRTEGHPLRIAIRHVGEQLAKETDPELQRLISTTFVLLGQEATTRRRYWAVLQTADALDAIEKTNSEMASDLRARIGLENRIPDFLEEALRMNEVPPELMEFLRRRPVATVEHIAGKLSRCVRRRERDRLVKLTEDLGPAAVQGLRDAFQSRHPASAIVTAGLLSRLDPQGLEEPLRARLREWNRMYHDAVVRQIASAGSPVRGSLLAKLLDILDPLVVPLAVDEIGMSGDASSSAFLRGIAGGELPRLNSPFLQVKAIEALGRLRVRDAIPFLTFLVQSSDSRRLAVPKEIQIAAAQSLQLIDREGAKTILANAGFKQAELELLTPDRGGEQPGVRQRQYSRVKLARPLAARIITVDGEFPASVRDLSLGGGLFSCEQRFSAGTPGRVRIKTGLRSIEAKIILRDARSELMAYEIVDMDLEDRTKLRALLQTVRK